MSHRTRIKICGITRAEDAEHAAACGADALGFVFVPASRRHLSTARAAELRRRVPPFVTTVALFMDAAPDAVRAVVDALQPDVLQFHGAETAAYCRGFGRPYVKTVPMADSPDLDAFAADYADAQALLLDGHALGEMGGSGRRVALQGAIQAGSLPCILAGGLTPDNVADAVRRARPWAVDVSSGVEGAPGIKDPARVAAFVEQVRLADEQAYD